MPIIFNENKNENKNKIICYNYLLFYTPNIVGGQFPIGLISTDKNKNIIYCEFIKSSPSFFNSEIKDYINWILEKKNNQNYVESLFKINEKMKELPQRFKKSQYPPLITRNISVSCLNKEDIEKEMIELFKKFCINLYNINE